jgi:hypothetical protein
MMTSQKEINIAKIITERCCNPDISRAIEKFFFRWKPYSAQSTRYSIYSLITQEIDPAWEKYIKSLPEDFYGREHKDTVLSHIGRTSGFYFLSKAIRNWIREAKYENTEFDTTLGSLSSLFDLCANKKSKSERTIENGNINTRRARQFCEFCGELTELSTTLKDMGNWPSLDADSIARLSTKYCAGHRPKNHDQSWNPKYLFSLRHKDQFNKELFLLMRQTGPKEHSLKKDIDEQFAAQIINTRFYYADEVKMLRNEARNLVDKKINFRKKEIVLYLKQGIKQIEIASKLGISKQEVFRAIKSIPAEYRLDLSHTTLNR